MGVRLYRAGNLVAVVWEVGNCRLFNRGFNHLNFWGRSETRETRRNAVARAPRACLFRGQGVSTKSSSPDHELSGAAELECRGTLDRLAKLYGHRL